MTTSKGLKALEKVALKAGVSVEEVRKEIMISIHEGMASTTPEAIAFWDKLSQNRTVLPTPEEFIAAMARRVNPYSQQT